MRTTVAIHADDYTNPATPDRDDASSAKWASALEKAGHTVKWVDVRRADILDQLKGCEGFMWRWAHFSGMGRIARRLLPVIERELGLVVYPDQNTCWHYDDKIAQAFLLPALGIPTPSTWVWFDTRQALEWAVAAEYPMVLKLATGASSSNVRLIRTFEEAQRWINRSFSQRLTTLDESQFQPLTVSKRMRAAARLLRHGTPTTVDDDGYDLQSGYVLFQEYLPSNAYDTRVTVIGRRAFAFRRFNRPDDFRASGSGKLDWDTTKVDPNMVRLAFRTARQLRSQSCAIDGLYRGNDCMVGEVSYTYVSWAVHACPGHWELHGDPVSGELQWVEGAMWPEEAQIEDFLLRLQASANDD